MAQIAYFSMEFGLSEELHTYAGGLGILAGDYLKGAAELRMPVVGIGILWRHGYTTQLIGETGWPYDRFPAFRYDDILEDTGVSVAVGVRGRPVALRVWRTTAFGNAPLLLLDANVEENDPADRQITAHLYGGDRETRIAQEIVLGIGGVRVLAALGIEPNVYHFNEGHAVLAGLELIRRRMEAGVSFEEAWQQVRRHIAFTTHTPVPAGNEWHPMDTLFYMGANCGLSHAQMAAIGDDPFNMTVAGLRLARVANAVSELHGHTARAMWAHVQNRAPIHHVTNGVHRGTWQRPEIAEAKDPEQVWAAHKQAKRELLLEIYGRTGYWLDPRTLLVGFARRAASYKRPDLVFRDRRMAALIEEGRVHLVFSSKAHPQDEHAKGIIARLAAKSRQYPDRVVFLPNYDMRLSRLMTQGCDVWLNNPRRPNEASGTSGMKAAMNGVLHVSTPDGWWPEAVEQGVNGWAFGGAESGDVDAYDAHALYEVMAREVIPTYYQDPERWRRMMLASVESTQEAFSVHRMLREYQELIYQEPAVTIGQATEENPHQ